MSASRKLARRGNRVSTAVARQRVADALGNDELATVFATLPEYARRHVIDVARSADARVVKLCALRLMLRALERRGVEGPWFHIVKAELGLLGATGEGTLHDELAALRVRVVDAGAS